MRTKFRDASDKDVEADLIHLKAEAIKATANADEKFYRNYLADDALGVTPMGVFTKPQILQAMAAGKAFKSSKIEDSTSKALGPNVGLVTYKATFDRPDGNCQTLFVSTVYERRDGQWKGVFYQQTPIPQTQHSETR